MRFHVSVARHKSVVLPCSVWMMYSGCGDTRKSCSIPYSSKKSSKLRIHTSRKSMWVGSKTAPTVPGLSMHSNIALAHNALVFPDPKPPMKPRMRCFSSLQNVRWAGSNPSTILNRNFSLVSFARLDTWIGGSRHEPPGTLDSKLTYKIITYLSRIVGNKHRG